MLQNLTFSRWRLGFAVLLAVVGVSASWAQTDLDIGKIYRFAQSNGTYTPITGGTVLFSGNFTTLDDNVSTIITIPSMNYGVTVANGTTAAVVNRMYVSSNGFITLGVAATTAPNTITTAVLSTATGAGAVGGFARDMQGIDASSEVRYQITGSDVVVQWKNLQNWVSGGAASGNAYNFQVILHTATGVIDMVYGACTSVSSQTGQVGIRGSSTSFPSNISNRILATATYTNTNWNATLGGIANTSLTTMNGAATTPAAIGIPASGLTFTYTPLALAGNIAMPGSAATSSGAATITATGATFGWTAASPAPSAGYNIRYRAVGTTTWTSTTTAAGVLTKVIPGLTPATSYEYEMQSNGGASGLSDWMHGRYFSTLDVCAGPPTGLGNNVTAIATPSTSINLTWTNNASATNGYNIRYRVLGAATWTSFSGNPVAAGSTTATLTGLTGTTSYQWQIASICAAGTSAHGPITPASFVTACDPIATFPWTEGFEAATAGTTVVGTSTNLPICWNSGSTQWSSTTATTYNNAFVGTKYIRYAWSTTNAFMWAPAFTLTAGTTYEFSFYGQGDGNTGWSNDIFVNTTPSATGATQLGATYVATSVGATAMQTYALVTRTFVPTTTGTYFFGIRGNQSSSSPWYMAFDNFAVTVLVPCTGTPMPGNTVTSVTSVCSGAGSATLGTALPTTGIGVTYQWQSAPDAAGAPGTFADIAGATGATYTATAIAASTHYQCVVTCATGSTATSTPVLVATTPTPQGNTFADPIDLTGQIDDGVVYTTTGNNLPANCWSDAYNTTSTPGNASARSTPDVFYQLTTNSCTDSLQVATCGSDTYISILDENGLRIAFNDDTTLPACALTTGESFVKIPVSPNTIYYIVAETWNTPDTFDIKITMIDGIKFTVAAAAAPASICVGGTITLNATPSATGAVAPIGYMWSAVADATYTSIVQNHTRSSAATASMSDDYMVVATDANGCIAMSDVVVTVNEPVTVDAGPDITTCTNSGTTMIVTGIIGGAGTTGTWSSAGNGVFSNPGTTWDGLGQVYTPGSSDLAGPFPKLVNLTLTSPAINGCPLASDIVALTIFQCPALITTPQTICAGESVDLTTRVSDANATTGTTAWYPTEVDAQNETNALASTMVMPLPTTTVQATVTYWVRKNTNVTLEDPGCKDIKSVVITVNPLPTITLGAVMNVCSNATSFDLPYTATTQAPTTYSISAGTAALTGFTAVVNAAMPASSPIVVTIPASSAAGTYDFNITVQNALTCTSIVYPFTVTIQPLPTATISYPATPFCTTVGSTAVTFTGTNSSGGTYTVAPTGLTLDVMTGAIDPSTSAGGTYVVTYTVAASGSCPMVTATASVVITPLPTAVLSYATPICTTSGDASPTLTGTFAYTGGVYTINNSGTIGAATGEVTNAAGSYTVTYTIASSAGCAAVVATAPLVITPLPTAVLSYTSPICTTSGNAMAALTGTNIFTGGVYTINNGGTIDASTGEVTNAAGSYTITYTIAAANGCAQVVATAPLVITALPVANISYTSPQFCTSVTSAPATLTGSNNAGGTYTAGAGLIINATTGAIDPSTSTAGSYTVTYTVAAAGGCAMVTATTIVAVTSLPTATITYSAAAYCKGVASALVTLAGANNAGGVYAAAPAGLTLSATGEINPSTSTAGIYTVSYTIAGVGGCATVTATAAVTIDALPVAVMTQNGPITCALPTVTLNATTSTGPATLTYAFSTGATATTTGMATVTAAGDYFVTVTSGAGCAATASVTVMGVPTAPNVTAAFSNVIDCINLSSVITATPSNIVGTPVYAWTTATPGSITGATNGVTAVAANAGIYTVVVTANGCQSTATVAVVKNTTAPVVNIAGPSSIGCVPAFITLTALGTASTYTWSANATAPAGASSGSLTAAGTYIVMATGTSNGCTNTAQKVVTVSASPPVINIMGKTAFCTGTSNTVMASPGFASYAWSNGVSVRSLTLTAAQATATAIYTVTVTAVNGCTTTKSITFVVSTIPTLTITSIPTVCSGSPLVGTATSSATTVNWFGPNSFTATGLTFTRPNATTAMNGTYIARATNSCGTRSVAAVATVRNAVPITVAIQNASVLGGSTGSATVTAPAGATFAWTGANGVTGTSLPYIRNKPAGTYTVVVTIAGNPCTTTRVIQIQ